MTRDEMWRMGFRAGLQVTEEFFAAEAVKEAAAKPVVSLKRYRAALAAAKPEAIERKVARLVRKKGAPPAGLAAAGPTKGDSR